MRLREVEIHHADLGAGYSPAQWSPDFCRVLLSSAAGREFAEPFSVLARDLAETWHLGATDDEPGAVVSGDAADLAWWLTGRGDGSDLASNTGTLPRIDPW